MRTTRLGIVAALVAGAACTRPGESRALAELEVGQGALADAEVGVAGGLAAIRELGDHRLALWAQAPVLDIEIALRTTAGAPARVPHPHAADRPGGGALRGVP